MSAKRAPQETEPVRSSALLGDPHLLKAQVFLERSGQHLAVVQRGLDRLRALAEEPNPHESREGISPQITQSRWRLFLSRLVSYFGGVVEWPNAEVSDDAVARAGDAGGDNESPGQSNPEAAQSHSLHRLVRSSLSRI